jgi:hypothetical protein
MTQEARYGVHFGYILFPIDFRDLRQTLARNGYELSRGEDIPAPPARIAFAGEIARKGEVRVYADSDGGEIGTVSRTLHDAYASFDGLASIIQTELNINLHENVRFYWIVSHYKADSGKMPYKEICKTGNDKFNKEFSEILGESVSPFSVRLSPTDTIINQENWFDIAIEPDVVNEKLYHIGVVFRNASREKTEGFAKDIEKNLLKMIIAIEA